MNTTRHGRETKGQRPLHHVLPSPSSTFLTLISPVGSRCQHDGGMHELDSNDQRNQRGATLRTSVMQAEGFMQVRL